MSKKSKKSDRINNNPELKALYHHYDSTIGLWVTDRLDAIPDDKKHLFWRLESVKELEKESVYKCTTCKDKKSISEFEPGQIRCKKCCGKIKKWNLQNKKENKND